MRARSYLVIHDEEMRVREQELQHVPRGLRQTRVGRVTAAILSLIPIFHVMPDFPLCVVSTSMCRILTTLEQGYLSYLGLTQD